MRPNVGLILQVSDVEAVHVAPQERDGHDKREQPASVRRDDPKHLLPFAFLKCAAQVAKGVVEHPRVEAAGGRFPERPHEAQNITSPKLLLSHVAPARHEAPEGKGALKAMREQLQRVGFMEGLDLAQGPP